MIFTIAALALLVPSNDTEQDRPAFTAFYDCLLSSAERDDDGHSDAATIALGIEPGCASQFQAAKEEVAAGMAPIPRRMMFDKMDIIEQQLAIQAVLAVRDVRAHAQPK